MLDLPANLAPIEIGQNGGPSISAQFGGQRVVFQDGYNFATKGFEIVIRDDERVVQVADTFGRGGERDNGLTSEHIVQKLHREPGTLGSGHDIWAGVSDISRILAEP